MKGRTAACTKQAEREAAKYNPRHGCSGVGVRAGVALGQGTLGLDCSPLCMPATLTFLSLGFLTHREQGTACLPKPPDVLGTAGQVHVVGMQQSKHGRWG